LAAIVLCFGLMTVKPMSASSRGYLFAAAAVALWSGFILVSRLGGISRLTAFDITAVRFATAAALLLPVWLARARAPIFNRRMAALAVTGGVGYALLVYSGFKLSSSRASPPRSCSAKCSRHGSSQAWEPPAAAPGSVR
jgi:threonine/homoserine efflux transporter RhtA